MTKKKSKEFSEELIESRLVKIKKRCECRRKSHNHPYGHCPNIVVVSNRGRSGKGAWEAHHTVITGGAGSSNLEILCWPCHQNTRNFGR